MFVRDVTDPSRKESPEVPNSDEPLPRVPPGDVQRCHQDRPRAGSQSAAAVPVTEEFDAWWDVKAGEGMGGLDAL